jgi:tetratricopeptide (TPR) repeat protein
LAYSIQSKRIVIILALIAAPGCVLADYQSDKAALGKNGKEGVAMLEDGGFEKARRYLEDAKEETPNNPVLYEYLGLAFLDCASGIDMKKCLAKADEYMDKALSLGGRAAVIADRSLAKGGVFNAGPGRDLNVARGKLYIYKDKLEFIPKSKGLPATITADEIKEVGMNKLLGNSVHTFHIKVKGESYDFRTANFSEEEAQLIFKLMEKYMGVKVNRGKNK